MPRKVQICPHCGASISGSPQQCPRCDGPLSAIPQSIADLGPIGPETEEMISSQSATPIEPVPADPIEEGHEDDVVLWRPSDSTSEPEIPQENSIVAEAESSADGQTIDEEAIQDDVEEPPSDESNTLDEPESSEEFQSIEEVIQEDFEEDVEELQSLTTEEYDTQDHVSTSDSDSEATAFDVPSDTTDAQDNAPFETQMDVETGFDEAAAFETNDPLVTGLTADRSEQSSLSFETEQPIDTDHLTSPDEFIPVSDEDTSPQVATASPIDEDTQSHIPVQADESSPQAMSVEEREAFENAQTAMIPAEESPINSVPTQAHPRPAEPVPEPTPLPLLSSMDTEPKVTIPEPPPIPPAPYTPPPPPPAAPPPSAFPVQAWQGQPSNYWLQQRMQAYLYGGYQIREKRPSEATLAYGKSLSFFWWVVAVMSVVGLLWYLFILILSGFRKDTVYIYLEHDGYIYEEGSGAAHIRRRRSRVARRWGVIGMLLAVFSTFTIIIMIVSVAILMNRYKAELASAYPESSFIQGNINTDNLDETQVQNVKVVVPVIIVMSALSAVGFTGGLAMSLISYLHSNAYRVEVAPLPDLR